MKLRSLLTISILLSGCASDSPPEAGPIETISAKPLPELSTFRLLGLGAPAIALELKKECKTVEGIADKYDQDRATEYRLKLDELRDPRLALKYKRENNVPRDFGYEALLNEISEISDATFERLRDSSQFNADMYTSVQIDKLIEASKLELLEMTITACSLRGQVANLKLAEETLEMFLSLVKVAESNSSYENQEAIEPPIGQEGQGGNLSNAPDALPKDCLRYSNEYAKRFASGRGGSFTFEEWAAHTRYALPVTGRILEPIYKSTAMSDQWARLAESWGTGRFAGEDDALVEVQIFCLTTTGIDITG